MNALNKAGLGATGMIMDGGATRSKLWLQMHWYRDIDLLGINHTKSALIHNNDNEIREGGRGDFKIFYL